MLSAMRGAPPIRHGASRCHRHAARIDFGSRACPQRRTDIRNTVGLYGHVRGDKRLATAAIEGAAAYDYVIGWATLVRRCKRRWNASGSATIAESAVVAFRAHVAAPDDRLAVRFQAMLNVVRIRFLPPFLQYEAMFRLEKLSTVFPAVNFGPDRALMCASGDPASVTPYPVGYAEVPPRPLRHKTPCRRYR